jgi:hypothetical protein
MKLVIDGKIIVLLVAATGFVIVLDLLTAPPVKVEANGKYTANALKPPEGVRRIPITRANNEGDPGNDLTPVYPAAPGKNLPIKDAPVVQAAQPSTPEPAPQHTTQASTPAVQNAVAPSAAKPVETSGHASARNDEPSAQAAVARTSIPAAGGACNVPACAAAFRSFRESDCTYQPYDGPRRFCDAGQGDAAQASIASSPARTSERRDTPAVSRKSQDQRDIEAAIRTVRGLPRAGEDDDGPVVTVRPRYGEPYGLQPRWIIEER